MLVNCAIYEAGRKIADIRPGEIGSQLARPEAFVWVGLYDPDLAELQAMAEQFGLPALAMEDAVKGQQRPKMEEYEDVVFVVLRTVEESPKDPQALLIGEVHLFVGRNYVVSIRHRTRAGFAEVRSRCEREPELLKLGPAYVLYALMDTVVDRYFPIVERLGAELDTLEAMLFDGSASARRIKDLYRLKRRLMTLRHAVVPLAETVGKLYGGRVPQIFLGMQEYYRDVYDHLVRIEAAIESIREMLTTAISVNIAMISLAEGETTKRLAAWGALITVPTLIAGIYGMNFKYIPELDWQGGYAFALGLMAVVDVVLYRRFRRARWL